MHGKLHGKRFQRLYLDILLAFGAAYQQLMVRPQALCIKLSQEHYLRNRTGSDPACIRTLSSTVACPCKITFPSRLLTVRLLLKRFHSSWLSCQVPYSWRIWWCVWKVQNRSPALSALTGPALPGSGLRTSPSDGPASTIASASTQMHTGNTVLFQLVLSWLEQEAREISQRSCQRQACCSHSSRSAERWVTVTAVYFTQKCINTEAVQVQIR